MMGWIHVSKETWQLEHVPNSVLQMAWASLASGNMGLSVHASSTIGSLTCRWFMDGTYKLQQVNKKQDDRQRDFKEKAKERID